MDFALKGKSDDAPIRIPISTLNSFFDNKGKKKP